jgi:hypothetical protein
MKRWTDEQLRDAVAQSRSISQTLRLLGLRPVGGNYDTIRRIVAELGLDTRHFVRRNRATATEAVLREAVASASTRTEAMSLLGWPSSSGSRRRLAEMVALYNVDTSHFRQAAWNKGMRFGSSGRPLSEHLVDGSTCKSSWLRLRLVEENILDPECAACGGRTWHGHPIPLELDHKNGDRRDNRLENLALLCPNCHALTPTYRGRNIGRYDGRLA